MMDELAELYKNKADDVEAEDAPKKVKFKKKLIRKNKPKSAAANETARASLKGPNG